MSLLRYFELQEGSSDKFWEIDRQEARVTVRFGRRGTQGQTKEKNLDSAEAAAKEYEKLIAEKTGKGYQERKAGENAGSAKPVSAPAAPPSVLPAAAPAAPPPVPAVAVAPALAPPPPPATVMPMDVPRSIELDPADWYWASWRQLPPPADEPVAAFNREECLERLKKVKLPAYGWEIDFSKCGLKPCMSREEAHFWLLAMAMSPQALRTHDVAPLLAAVQGAKIDGNVMAKELPAMMRESRVGGSIHLPEECMHVFGSLFSGVEVMDLVLELHTELDYWSCAFLVPMFKKRIVPRLSVTELARCREKLRPEVTPARWSVGDSGSTPFRLAAALGMHDELLSLVSSWPDDFFSNGSGWAVDYSRPQEVLFGLCDPALVRQHMQRLGLRLQSPLQARGWLAHTEYAALEWIADAICKATNKEAAEEVMEVFRLVHAPEAVAPMLDIYLGSKVPRLAREWIDANPAHAIAGLVRLVAERGRRADSAIEFLRSFRKRGYGAAIRAAAEAAGDAAILEKVRGEILEVPDHDIPPFSAADTPEWLHPASGPAKRVKLPAWLHPGDLPPVVVGQNRLTDAQVEQLLQGLSAAASGESPVLLGDVKTYADPASLEAFVWRLFELWLAEGAPAKDKWAFLAVGCLGGDRCALKVTPLIRAWPGESQHARAVLGLEVLRAIGSETALMQLNGIAQKIPFKGLKAKAAECMEAIAADKGLTRAELEDRCVPDCGLDENGRRVFDFGPRQFCFAFGPDLKPMVRDDKGGLKDNLPAPTAKDDAALAGNSVDEWKLLKKQVREVAKVQAFRLEQAMVTGRRWSVPGFEQLMVRHPLMTHLVRLLLWGGFDAAGKLAGTFRVTEELDYADADDAPVSPAAFATVGIVHPLQLNDELKNRWGELLSDYAVIPPFTQLGRPVYRLAEGESGQPQITRFKGLKIVAPTLVFGLEKLGWQRGVAMDAGCFDEHSKQFPAAALTAVVRYEGSVGMGYIDPNELLTLEEIWFVRGMRAPSCWEKPKDPLPLAAVDPIVVSEVLADLQQLAAKAKP